MLIFTSPLPPPPQTAPVSSPPSGVGNWSTAGWLWESSGEPPANKPICPECGKIYSNNSNLKQHIANVHSSAQSWELCQVCGKRFKTKQYLQVHLLATHGIRQRKSYNPFYPGEVQN
ncbi:hypothetical protein J6590_055502 [Homalodisca vitripennis]|nr:hypothetical protein J6590_055502 [Homalodisca vitripennis]